jgi:hypothetical protein
LRNVLERRQPSIRLRDKNHASKKVGFCRLRSLTIDREFDERVLDFLRRNYGRVFGKVWRSGGSRIGVFIHEEFVFRTSTNQTLTTVFESMEGEGRSKITVIGSGGGEGVFGIDWGSESAGENTIASRIRQIATFEPDQ